MKLGIEDLQKSPKKLLGGSFFRSFFYVFQISPLFSFILERALCPGGIFS